MSRLSMSVPVADDLHEVDYVVTHEGCGPSFHDPGEPLEFYVVTVGDLPAKDVPPKLMEAIEDFIHEHHEPDDGDPDWDRGWEDAR